MLRTAILFLTWLLLSALSTAQNVFIYAPPPHSTFAPGESFVVDVDRPVRIPLPPPTKPFSNLIISSY